MSIWDRILGVLAIVLFIALAIGFSHFAEKVNGDDDDLRTKAERAMKELKYREAHSYLEELFKPARQMLKIKITFCFALRNYASGTS